MALLADPGSMKNQLEVVFRTETNILDRCMAEKNVAGSKYLLPREKKTGNSDQFLGIGLSLPCAS
jgi:hypothetical protein